MRGRRGATLLVLLAIILVLLVAADLTAKRVAEAELADRVQEAVPEAEGSSVDIHSFPFLARLLKSGKVAKIDARVEDITVRGLRFDSITVQLQGVVLDRDQLLADRRVVLERITRGEARAEIPESSLADRLGIPITLEQGRASVEIFGRRLGASLAVRDGTLIVSGAGIDLPALDLTGPLLPCVANVTILPRRVALTCGFIEIPRELVPNVQL